MFLRRYTLFRMFGFAVRIDLSWLLIVALVVWSLAGTVFPARYADAEGHPLFSRAVYYAMGASAALALFASIVFHELCHSLVARRFGLVMKGITLFIFGGVAEMEDEPKSPRAEFLMAVAGPASSLLLALGFFGLSALGGRAGWHPAVNGVLGWTAGINAILAAFNLIPGFPLDGGRVLRSALWRWRGDLRWATRIASLVGSGFGGALIALGVVSMLFWDTIGGLWYILIGLFLRGAARAGYQQVIIRQALEGERVRRFMNPDVVSVPPGITLAELVDDYVFRYHYRTFPVAVDGRLVGCVGTREVQAVPRDQWPVRTVGEIAVSCAAGSVISPDTDAVRALALINRGAPRLYVVDDGRLVGVLSLRDLMRFLSLKVELDSKDDSDLPPPPDDEG